jgi:hypothetical protein
MPQPPLKMTVSKQVVKIDLKIIVLLLLSKSLKQTVEAVIYKNDAAEKNEVCLFQSGLHYYEVNENGRIYSL